MGSFFSELKRRHIYRVAAAYAVVAWVLIQLVNNVTPMLRLPEWAGTLVLVLLLVGFPVALLFAWIHQLAPESGALARATTGKLDWLLVGALVAVIGIFVYQQLAPATATRTAEQPGVAAARAAAVSPAGAISIAVLPFANLSADPEQEFFSAGMTEEITSALAKIPDLRVVARTSAFQFKDQNRDIQAIAQALHATHLVEGSVRKAGTRLRITAQLINAESGVSIWTENYDREYTDVFAIQEDIATAIAGALRMPLGLKPGERLVSNRTSDLKAYEDYLRVRAIGALARSSEGDEASGRSGCRAIPALRPPGRRLPTFTGKGVEPATRQSGSVEEVRRVAQSWLDKAEMAARKAIELDSRSRQRIWRIGLGSISTWKMVGRREAFSPGARAGFRQPGSSAPLRQHVRGWRPPQGGLAGQRELAEAGTFCPDL